VLSDLSDLPRLKKERLEKRLNVKQSVEQGGSRVSRKRATDKNTLKLWGTRVAQAVGCPDS